MKVNNPTTLHKLKVENKKRKDMINRWMMNSYYGLSSISQTQFLILDHIPLIKCQ